MRPRESCARARRAIPIITALAISLIACTPTVVHTTAPPPRTVVTTAPPPRPDPAPPPVTTAPPPRPDPGPPVVRRHVWDTNGWQKLGEQTVDGARRADTDTIVVGRYEGRFSKLTMVVDDSDLELLDFAVTFGPRGEVWRPSGVGHYFRENQRTRVIDLPGDDRIIQKIDLRYRNLPGGGKARVEIWGFKQVATPPPVAFTWDSRGWTLLGEQTVDYGRRVDKDRITVGKDAGKFDRLMLVVLDGDLNLIDMTLSVGRGGQAFKPVVAQYFRENTRTRAIDLPGEYRTTIHYIDFTYKNIPGGPRARVQVWAKDGGPSGPPVVVPKRHVWDTKGWVKLGHQTVDGARRADTDTITVGRYEGRFSKLTMVVDDSDLELLDFAVTFGPRGEVWRPSGVGHYFRENQRTRVIDLPGDDRIIQKIDLRYRNLPGGGKASVEIWGFKDTSPPRPVIRRATWDNKGWVKLGEQTVDHGRRADKDTIVVGRYEGRFAKLTMVVEDDDLELLDFAVTFGPRGEVWRPASVGHYFRENQRTRVIDLPGDTRVIQKIDLKYRNLPGGGRAKVEIWGFKK